MKDPTISFQHFGCKVNFAESSSIANQFRELGYTLKDPAEPASIQVINTCMVTASAEKKCRAAIRKVHQRHPDAIIAVIGCFSELNSEKLSKMDGVEIVLGQQDKFNLPDAIQQYLNRDVSTADPKSHREDGENNVPEVPSGWNHTLGKYDPAFSIEGRTRSFLKIQDGCDYHCAYCTIPLARGRSRSGTIQEIISQSQKVAGNDIREIVLTGINIGDFGKHQGESLMGLMEALEKVRPVPRIRLSSIEPDLLHPEIIELVASSNLFLPSFHIPLQSGSNKILKLMKRKYLRELFQDRVETIRQRIPDACIAADVITGFPGETDEDAEETLRFLKEVPLSYLHVFSFSKREHTLAAQMKETVPKATIKQRSVSLHQLSASMRRIFVTENQGTLRQVLFESAPRDGFMFGWTENYLKVKTPFNPSLINQIKPVILLEPDKELVYTVHFTEGPNPNHHVS